MRPRSVILVLLGVAAAVGMLRRLQPAEYVDVRFEDGSSIRLARGVEGRDLLDDAYEILEAAR